MFCNQCSCPMLEIMFLISNHQIFAHFLFLGCAILKHESFARNFKNAIITIKSSICFKSNFPFRQLVIRLAVQFIGYDPRTLPLSLV